MITDQEKASIRRTWKLVVPIAETAADLFYKRLFELEPKYQALFPEDMTAQKRKLVRMLAFVVRSLDWSEAEWRDSVSPNEDLMLVILALGRRHTDLYKVPDESYATVGEALLWTLDKGLGQAFTPDVQAAWAHVYELLALTMRMSSHCVDANASLPDAARSGELGRAAMIQDLARAGIDETRLGLEGDPS